jgi:hypothetical protein
VSCTQQAHITFEKHISYFETHFCLIARKRSPPNYSGFAILHVTGNASSLFSDVKFTRKGIILYIDSDVM